MYHKNLVRVFLLAAILLAAFGSVGSAHAWSACGPTYVVRWGDTLSSIAAWCGISMYDLQLANPGTGWWIYAGQTLNIPGASYYQPAPPPYYGTGGTYFIQPGDTLRNIANRYGVTVSDILSVNPQIWNPNWIYAGQVIALPARPTYYTVQPGDTLFNIATRYGTSVASLQYLNPQVWNPNWIYAGQVIRVW